jgi:hypothetical protein
MEELTPEVQQSKYHPLTFEEYKELKEKMETISVTLPDNMLGYVWNNYNRLNGTNISQPCSCQSAAGHWKAAVELLKDWVKQRV